jgi:hypothetical protein
MEILIVIVILFTWVVGFLLYKTINTLKPKPKFIKIPLVQNGKDTGTWVECFEEDEIYNKLKKAYGNIPTQIEVEPITKNNQ